MAGCITQDYRDILVTMISADVEKSALLSLIQHLPLCEVAKPPKEEVERAKRAVPEVWGIEPIYFDENGKETKFSSPSALVKALGLEVSGIQCDVEGKKCKAMNVVDIMRIHGYTVSGDGEPRKAAEGGEKLTIYHPNAPQARLAQIKQGAGPLKREE